MAEPVFLTKEIVLEIHAAQIAEHGGASGLRDEGLLDSAVSQPPAAFCGQYLHADIFHMAAAYLFHIGKNHPFVDGNKRTALASCLVFLDVNGVTIRDQGGELADVVLEMIERRRDKHWLATELECRALPRLPKRKQIRRGPHKRK